MHTGSLPWAWAPIITFANDLNGDRVISPDTEEITYDVSGTTLRRTVGPGPPEA